MEKINLIKWLILAIVCIPVLIYILKINYVIGSNTGTKKAVLDNKQKLKLDAKSLKTQKRLAYFNDFSQRVGGALKNEQRYDWEYRMNRLRITIASTGHEVTVNEFIGILRYIQIAFYTLALLFVFLGVWAAGAIFFLLGFNVINIVAGFIDFMLKSSEIDVEKDFPDFYMFIYTRLMKGANANLTVAVQDYYRNLQQIYPRKGDHTAIKRFVEDFLNILAINSTEVEAVTVLRERYKSAIIASFCNLAAQALRGVDNREKLISFQMDLLGRQKDEMERVAKTRAEWASYTIYSIYIILFEFIVLSWMSKIDLSMFANIFSF